MPSKKDYPLSGKELHDMILEMNERPNIIDDKIINEKTTIEDIFKGSGHVILFKDWGGKVGHWYAMVRNYKGEVYFFDSFGEHPDKYNKHIKTAILKSQPKLLYNDIPFQKDSSSCCGRHALLVCALNKMGKSPKEIEEAFKSLDDPDKFVIDLIRK